MFTLIHAEVGGVTQNHILLYDLYIAFHLKV